ncbi:hypothetical protein CFC21_047918 [Triticum aestivum]|uniref:amino-acid N-acetyltransferase n=2 Tax=Triticum aestivum TaxID=4565 RepID=A0A9R1K1L6_WHEAT|nr:hypothetical protein CFC21_047918 [Triticum aestivum]
MGWFREAWLYIRGDILLLHSFGIKFVLIPGIHVEIDKLLAERGKKAKYVGHYCITDSDALEAAMEAVGRIRLSMEAKLSSGPPMLNLQRHGVNCSWHEKTNNVASGNFLGAKVRGGIDYGFTGEVKKIDVSRIRERLDRDSIVIVSNMGYSSVGEVLNCNTYEVAMACALTIEADKRICIVDGQISDEHGRGIHFMSAKEANMLIRARIVQSEISANHVKVVGEKILELGLNGLDHFNRFTASFRNGVGFNNGNGLSGKQGFTIVHIIDGTVGGSLLLELFTIDNVETMIARNKMAREEDLPGTEKFIRPLDESGVVARRTDKEVIIYFVFRYLVEALASFAVVERDQLIIACVALFLFPEEKSGELAALVVSEECRGQGQGDNLLVDNFHRFVRRGFNECSIESLAVERRK